MDIIIGTAGHIDHGKTALVKALTGVDTDRFPEEKERGITIDIGFAELKLENLNIGFVDVPGHERFVKNMLAGAHGIDLVMLVVAADEGVMPQTREHFEICRLLETKSGLIVLTKKDLVDPELLEIAELDVAELVENSFLQDAPVIAVSAKNGDGIDELKAVLHNLGSKIDARADETVMRLPIDRIFTVKGFGAVVTGTLVSGEINEGDELEILPISKKVRVRGLQVHGKSVKTAVAGQRSAVNLSGIELAEIERGMILTEKDVLRPNGIIDAEIETLKDAKKSLKTRQRVRIHLGTAETLARIQVINSSREIKQGEKDLVQIRLESPVAVVPGEHIILRSYSPQVTIAGGRVLDSHPGKHRTKDFENVRKFLTGLKEAEAERSSVVKLFLSSYDIRGASFSDLQARTGLRKKVLQRALELSINSKSVIVAEDFYIGRTAFDALAARTLKAIEEFHLREPLARGISRETLRDKIFANLAPQIFRTVLAVLETQKKIVSTDFVRLAGHSLELSESENDLRKSLLELYRSAKLEVPKLEDALNAAAKSVRSDAVHARKIFQLLLNSGELIKITEEFYFSKYEIEKLVLKLREYGEKSTDKLIDVAKFKDIAGVSRKYAIPLLEYFDREKITRRAADKRLIL